MLAKSISEHFAETPFLLSTSHPDTAVCHVLLPVATYASMFRARLQRESGVVGSSWTRLRWERGEANHEVASM